MFRSLFCSLALLCVSSSAIAQIRLGVSAPLTGPLAFLGKEVADGANLAATAINAQGGVRGTRLELIFVDDSCRPDRADESSRRLILADKVAALLGYPCQQTAVAVSRIADETNKLLIALAPPTPAVQSALYMVAGDSRLGTMVSDLLAAKYAGKRIGLRLSDSNLSFAQALNRALERRSIRAVASESVPPNTISVPDWMTAVDVAVIGPGVAPVAAVSDFTGKNPNVTIIAPAGFLRPIGIEYPPNLILVANLGRGFPRSCRRCSTSPRAGPKHDWLLYLRVCGRSSICVRR
jgi:ABC-type branched-subunit amino acid transport system substrate-binding protein